MEIKNIKLLGSIGVLLAILSIIPMGGFIFGLAGLVLVFIAMLELSKKTNNKKIYDNFFVSFIFSIVGSVLGGIALVSTFVLREIGFFRNGIFYRNFFDRDMRFFPKEPFLMQRNWDIFNNLSIGAIVTIVIFVLVIYGILVARAYFLKKSYEEVTKETQVEYFKTAGNLIFIGSILLIVLVGFIIYFIGYIFEIVAFFSLKEDLNAPLS